MTAAEQIITIGLCATGTIFTRFLPFIIFNEKRKTPEFIKYIGKYLSPAVFGMLIVYCLKNVNFAGGSHGLSELTAIFVTGVVHIWKRKMVLSIALGTVCYMILIHLI